MGVMKLSNINGTSDKDCGCGSWLNHWKDFSGQSVPSYCPEKNCYEKSLIGAHVQKYDSADKSWYIYPLCKTHNAKTDGPLEVSDTYKLVSANVAESCGKK
jgi:hypothetical protein